MKTTQLSIIALPLLAAGILAGCSTSATKSPDVSDSVRKALDQAGFKNVSVTEDRDKGVVTIGGQVESADAKSNAESLTKSLAGAQVVADQIMASLRPSDSLRDNLGTCEGFGLGFRR